MSRHSLIGCGLLLLGMVGFFTALPYAEAEPLISGDSSEVTVTATIPEYAEASLTGDIEVTDQSATYASGSTGINAAANFPYSISVHWLEGKVWDPGYYTTVASTVAGPHDPGSVNGTVTVEGYPDISDDPDPVGTAEGADASYGADVYYDASVVGVVQVTISHQ